MLRKCRTRSYLRSSESPNRTDSVESGALHAAQQVRAGAMRSSDRQI